MNPESQRILGGNQQQAMGDVSRAAGAYDYPTRGTGLTRSIGGQAAGLASRTTIGAAMGEGASAVGLPRAAGWGLGAYGVAPLANSIHGAILQSGAARRGLARNYTPGQMPSIAELLAQLTAAASANRRNDQYD
jgi:hypothetical protein